MGLILLPAEVLTNRYGRIHKLFNILNYRIYMAL